MARRKYYTLLERTPGELWSPQFGDYDKQVVIQERDDMKQSGSFVKGTTFLIVTTNGTQADLTKAVEQHNDAIKARALTEKKPGFAEADLKRHAAHNEKVAGMARRRYGAGPD